MRLIKRKALIILLIICTAFIGCFSQKGEKKIKENNTEIDNVTFIDIIMEKDTLETKEEKGLLRYYFKLNDSTHLTSKDERNVSVVLALGPLSNDTSGKKGGEKFEKEVNFKPISNDTIEIPFTITPHFSGKSRIVGFISDIYSLNYYNKKDNNKVRMITYENGFEKEFYIK
ncbi:hypothetical protein [Tenacibaculum discolor]|uniref:hypothetical protein n=1 Tax=Tenacibaculum discolor TaxID=361581 RepID=UPI003F7A2395